MSHVTHSHVSQSLEIFTHITEALDIRQSSLGEIVFKKINWSLEIFTNVNEALDRECLEPHLHV